MIKKIALLVLALSVIGCATTVPPKPTPFEMPQEWIDQWD